MSRKHMEERVFGSSRLSGQCRDCMHNDLTSSPIVRNCGDRTLCVASERRGVRDMTSDTNLPFFLLPTHFPSLLALATHPATRLLIGLIYKKKRQIWARRFPNSSEGHPSSIVSDPSPPSRESQTSFVLRAARWDDGQGRAPCCGVYVWACVRVCERLGEQGRGEEEFSPSRFVPQSLQLQAPLSSDMT